MKVASFAVLATILFGLIANEDVSASPVQCTSFSDDISIEQMNAIVPMLASPSMRAYHRDWHFLRSKWPTLTESEKAKYLSEGWTPPRDENLLKMSNDSDLESEKSVAGEDFLLMHRKMIEMVQEILVFKHLPCIAGWRPIPIDLAGHTGNGDLWPVPTEQLQPYLWTQEGRQLPFTDRCMTYGRECLHATPETIPILRSVISWKTCTSLMSTQSSGSYTDGSIHWLIGGYPLTAIVKSLKTAAQGQIVINGKRAGWAKG